MSCSLDGTPRGRMVDELLSLGYSAVSTENATRAKGAPVKRETVTKHLRECLGGVRPEPGDVAAVVEHLSRPLPKPVPKPLNPPVPASKPSIPRPSGPMPAKDFAKMVQDKTAEALERGDLRISVRDGLAATAILDKREARTEDRRFVLGLARLLSGAGIAGPRGDDPNVIDVTPARSLLAPPALREGD